MIRATHGHRDIVVRIDKIAVDIGDDQRAEQAAETVRAALALLGARLARAPLALATRGPAQALDYLDLGPVDPQWLAGPGAASRLADRLYERLLDHPGGPRGR